VKRRRKLGASSDRCTRMEWRHEVRLTRNGGSIVSYLESIFSLRGKNALVTGAASGLGAAPPLRRRAAIPSLDSVCPLRPPVAVAVAVKSGLILSMVDSPK
jgi:hypothetical protein